MRDLVVQCPSCSQEVSCDASLVNSEIKCPSCDASFLVPKTAVPPPLPPSAIKYARRRRKPVCTVFALVLSGVGGLAIYGALFNSYSDSFGPTILGIFGIACSAGCVALANIFECSDCGKTLRFIGREKPRQCSQCCAHLTDGIPGYSNSPK